MCHFKILSSSDYNVDIHQSFTKKNIRIPSRLRFAPKRFHQLLDLTKLKNDVVNVKHSSNGNPFPRLLVKLRKKRHLKEFRPKGTQTYGTSRNPNVTEAGPRPPQHPGLIPPGTKRPRQVPDCLFVHCVAQAPAAKRHRPERVGADEIRFGEVAGRSQGTEMNK